MSSIDPENQEINESTRLIKKKNNKDKLYILYVLLCILITLILVILVINYFNTTKVIPINKICNLNLKKIKNKTCTDIIVCIDAASCVVRKNVCPNCNLTYLVTFIIYILLPTVVIIFITSFISVYIAIKCCKKMIKE
jgi:1,4-dihydroxy-2-naphthoate octaprenyltransferase